MMSSMRAPSLSPRLSPRLKYDASPRTAAAALMLSLGKEQKLKRTHMPPDEPPCHGFKRRRHNSDIGRLGAFEVQRTSSDYHVPVCRPGQEVGSSTLSAPLNYHSRNGSHEVLPPSRPAIKLIPVRPDPHLLGPPTHPPDLHTQHHALRAQQHQQLQQHHALRAQQHEAQLRAAAAPPQQPPPQPIHIPAHHPHHQQPPLPQPQPLMPHPQGSMHSPYPPQPSMPPQNIYLEPGQPHPRSGPNSGPNGRGMIYINMTEAHLKALARAFKQSNGLHPASAAQVKDRVSQETGLPLEVVDDWFKRRTLFCQGALQPENPANPQNGQDGTSSNQSLKLPGPHSMAPAPQPYAHGNGIPKAERVELPPRQPSYDSSSSAPMTPRAQSLSPSAPEPSSIPTHDTPLREEEPAAQPQAKKLDLGKMFLPSFGSFGLSR